MPTPSPRRLDAVAPGVLVTTAQVWTSNAVLVRGDDGAVLLVDPGITVDDVEALAAAVVARGWRVVAAVATHPHWDHVLWSRSLGRVPRFASARAVRAMAGDVERSWADAQEWAPGHDRALFAALTAFEGTELPEPAPPGCRAVVHDAHAPGHAALAVRGVLVAGDMLLDTEVPLLDVGPGADASRAPDDPVGDYRRGLDALEAAVAAHGVEVLVPGHGRVGRGAAAIAARFAADRAYLDALEKAAGGGPAVRDRRLTDGWVAGEHAAQLARLRAL